MKEGETAPKVLRIRTTVLPGGRVAIALVEGSE